MSWIQLTVTGECGLCGTDPVPLEVELELGMMNSVELPCGCRYWYYLPTVDGDVPGDGLPLGKNRHGLRLIHGGKGAA